MFRDVKLQREADERRQRLLRSARKAAPAPVPPSADRVATFAKARKFSAAATAVLGVVVEHVERTGQPYTGDGFELAEKAGIGHEAATRAKAELHMRSALRTRSGNAWGLDGLVPGDAWIGPGALSATWATAGSRR